MGVDRGGGGGVRAWVAPGAGSVAGEAKRSRECCGSAECFLESIHPLEKVLSIALIYNGIIKNMFYAGNLFLRVVLLWMKPRSLLRLLI